MEYEGSLSCSQEINAADATPSYFSKIQFNIILTPTSISS
jgi:hypothetical protein